MAANDFAEAPAAYIARDNPDAARRFIDASEQTCQMLLSNPEIGHQESFRRLRGIRSWRVSGFKNHLVFYRVGADSVEILRLIHGARPAKILPLLTAGFRGQPITNSESTSDRWTDRRPTAPSAKRKARRA